MFNTFVQQAFIKNVKEYCDIIVEGYVSLCYDKPELDTPYVEMLKVALMSGGYETAFNFVILDVTKEYIKARIDNVKYDFEERLAEEFRSYEESYFESIAEESIN